MNKIRVIDLLNKIANGEEVPKKFIWDDKEYYSQFKNCYRCDETSTIFEDDFVLEHLNDEVEILEEEKKIPEEITMCTSGIMSFDAVEHITSELKDKINSIIDYLKSKGE